MGTAPTPAPLRYLGEPGDVPPETVLPMRLPVSLSLVIAALYACADSSSSATAPSEDGAAVPAASSAAAPRLTHRWETDTTLTTVESVRYDPQRQRLYVSNIEDNPWEADGRGSIGIVGLDGDVTDARWVTGLNAPKGMGIYDGKLYAADLDAVVEIDIEANAIVARHAIDGAEGLNDIDVAADGTLYVSDSKTGRVHRGRPGAWTTVVDDMERPNGVLVTADGVLLGDTGAKTLSRLTPDGQREVLAQGIEPDGIVALRDGGYLVSRWGGEIYYVSEDWTATSLFESEVEADKTADIGYVPEQDLVLVPTFFGNRVVAYGVE